MFILYYIFILYIHIYIYSIYLKHVVAFAVNTTPHLAIPVHVASSTRALSWRFRFIIYLEHAPSVERCGFIIYLEHAPSCGDAGSSYIINTPPHVAIQVHHTGFTINLDHTPSFGSGSSYILNTPPHLTIPVHHIFAIRTHPISSIPVHHLGFTIYSLGYLSCLALPCLALPCLDCLALPCLALIAVPWVALPWVSLPSQARNQARQARAQAEARPGWLACLEAARPVKIQKEIRSKQTLPPPCKTGAVVIAIGDTF